MHTVPAIKKPTRMGLKQGIGYSWRRYYVDSFLARQEDSFRKAGAMLDVGGLRNSKRGQFNIFDYNSNVLTINISHDRGTDIVCDAAHMPLSDNLFDCVICSEVLEHVPEPAGILSEIQRVMKDGATLYITAPFLFPVHGDPGDYGRYTPSCWSYMIEKAGLQLVEIAHQGNYWIVLADMLRAYIYREIGNKYLKFGLYCLLRPFLYLASRTAERPSSGFTGSFATGYGVIARKIAKTA